MAAPRVLYYICPTPKKLITFMWLFFFRKWRINSINFWKYPWSILNFPAFFKLRIDIQSYHFWQFFELLASWGQFLTNFNKSFPCVNCYISSFLPFKTKTRLDFKQKNPLNQNRFAISIKISKKILWMPLIYDDEPGSLRSFLHFSLGCCFIVIYFSLQK